ncbi:MULTISPECIES: glutamine-hydrolyzing GMP synthase [unclassified Pedobacter]|uniref:glutamine-hydrolyzing GMP synthase n=1 Tax=unclassified Pedobacter TaxID=2628915 RepID=UPI001D818A22|nr:MULTISPECIES: glutamine-hydrolyzing GMP synthase [unclassified Pedobacter]CAH0313415.1 GMP synthase [glutamine-hydrolyzing] [Pedobacter sp. Bi36]CAH0318058.1 GMP synthase [glutamine-hydrolyzing] [Pedobacter sp. Bi126]
MQEKIIIVDFGSQFTQLIARRVRELNIYCEIYPYNNLPEVTPDVKGVIFSGSPFSVRQEDAPQIDLSKYHLKFPLLAVCYGAQYIAQHSGGAVQPSSTREYGRANLNFVNQENKLFKGINIGSQVWMSHGDTITDIPENFELIASTDSVKVAAYHLKDSDTYAIQFHPEVTHSIDGKILLENFLVDICGCSQDWTSAAFVETTIADIKATVGNDKVVLALSGGVDSSVAAVLLHKAIGTNLHCIFVDNGLLRKNEYESVLEQYKDFGLNIKGVDAKDKFLGQLAGVEDPETKRKIIGRVFIEVFDEESHLIQDVKWLAQGTIYPDIIESVSVKGPSATIKSHHNVGGLPDFMKLKVVEPLKTLFKDEVRRVGTTLGLESFILGRHPFPGPGLGIRIIGEVTPEKVAILQDADKIYIDNLKEAGLYDKVWQAGAIFLPVRSVGVMGDERTYENVIALRAVESLDGMTADWCHLPYPVLAKISNEIINKVKGINRVVYDISSKPPATIEWE